MEWQSHNYYKGHHLCHTWAPHPSKTYSILVLINNCLWWHFCKKKSAHLSSPNKTVPYSLFNIKNKNYPSRIPFTPNWTHTGSFTHENDVNCNTTEIWSLALEILARRVNKRDSFRLLNWCFFFAQFHVWMKTWCSGWTMLMRNLENLNNGKQSSYGTTAKHCVAFVNLLSSYEASP